ncbi:MAG TPA: branched-chain amino acid ABC transporter permease [Chloroflexota bacterium]|jgi:branched-chain amino acid transport system permease protein|nr:branched-chain amino acid ABC transporter permease [Chloroflexota bacterium]
MADFLATYANLINFLGINALLGLSIYATLATGQLSVGNAAFMGIGAYTAALLVMRLGVPFLPSLLVGSLAGGGAAFLLGLPVVRLSGVFLAIATIGFGEIVRIVALNSTTLTGGAQGLNGVPPLTQTWQIYLALAVVLFIFWRIRGSRLGYTWEAIRQDELAARNLGINTARHKVLAFALGGLLAGLAGGLAAHFTFFIGPNEYGFTQATNILVYAIVGGSGVFWGPVLGSTLITLLPEVLRGSGVAAGAMRLFVNGLILLLVVLFLPNGLASLFRGRK